MGIEGQWWDRRTVWVSGTTGAWGTEICKQLLTLPVRRILAYCRGEHRAAELYEKFQDDRIRIRLGDIRDRRRTIDSMAGADCVVHAAALKRIDTITTNAIETVRTNVDGTICVVDACVAIRPEKALFISSDKAVRPLNLYGATKMVGEHLWLAGNSYAPPPNPCKFSVLRSGNVLGSTGSVVHVWRRQYAQGQPLTLVDPGHTRFHITLSDVVQFLLEKIPLAHGGEIFIPHMRAYSIGDLLRAFLGAQADYPVQRIELRDAGEKRAEQLEPEGRMSSEVTRISVSELRTILRQEGFAI